jgi:hypothetical protein
LQPTYNNYIYNVSGLILNQRYAFKHSATNNYGISSNSTEILIRPGYVPLVIDNTTVSIEDKYVIIQWDSAFYTSYSIKNFEVQFLSSSGNWY